MANHIRRTLLRFPAALGLAVTALGILLTASPATRAQDKTGQPNDPEAFGDIFTHPRDRFYLPGQAPSRAVLEDSRTFEDSRGRVNRYEYEKNGRVISRETWTDERGESQGRIGIGRRF
jgi:hypothetical protein